MATIRVKTDYPTISEAVAAAYPGDIICVENGIYTESIVTTKDNIGIVGGRHTVLNGGFSLDSAFTFNGTHRFRLESLIILNYKQSGVTINGGVDNIVTSVRISDCLKSGIALLGAGNSLINCSEISGAGEYGIYARNADGLRIEKNRITSCYPGGIYSESAGLTPVLIRNNELCMNIGAGLNASGPGTALVCNMADSNLGNGITVVNGVECAVIENTSSGNSKNGILIESGSASVIKNRALSNENDGIIINSGVSVRDNNIHRNKNNGLSVYGTKNTVEGNQITENAVYDILRARPDNCFESNNYNTSNPRDINSSGPHL